MPAATSFERTRYEHPSASRGQAASRRDAAQTQDGREDHADKQATELSDLGADKAPPHCYDPPATRVVKP